MKVKIIIVVLICCCCLMGCTNKSDDVQSVEDQLSIIKSGMNVQTSAHYNEERLIQLDSFDKAAEVNRKNIKLLTYWKARELVNAGHELEAIDFIQQNQQQMQNQIDSLDEVLLEAYLRGAESSNCIHHHNSNSCIMPFESDGVHTLKENSQLAIKMIEKMLEKDSNRNDLKWLYNVLAMTIDTFPEGVPESFRLDLSNESKYPDFKFIDEGVKRGINDKELAGGTCLDDFDNDGDLDVVFSSMTLNGKIHYYENSDGVFIDKTKEHNLENVTGGLNMIHCDFNNDGFLDIYVMRGGWEFDFGNVTNSLLKNIEGKHFEDVTIKAGLLNHAPCGSSVWADFNNDGFLDLYEGIEENDFSKLYINNQDETFSEVSNQAKCSIKKFVKGVVSADIEADGDMDIFVSIVGDSNILFLNEGLNKGIPQFRNIALVAGVTDPLIPFLLYSLTLTMMVIKIY